MPLSILHEDERLLAVAKSAGQLVIPGRGTITGPTLQEQVAEHFGGKVYVVHRLDRGASGIVLFAKDSAAHRALCLAFETRQVRKVYAALVQGLVEKDGAVDRPIRAFGSGRMGIGASGKPSITRYRVLDRLPTVTFLEIEPETGRRHQIRVHLHSIGHPILGDPLYGKERPVGGAPRLMLHAIRLGFKLESRAFEIACDIPRDFAEVLEDWRAASGNSRIGQ